MDGGTILSQAGSFRRPAQHGHWEGHGELLFRVRDLVCPGAQGAGCRKSCVAATRGQPRVLLAYVCVCVWCRDVRLSLSGKQHPWFRPCLSLAQRNSNSKLETSKYQTQNIKTQNWQQLTHRQGRWSVSHAQQDREQEKGRCRGLAPCRGRLDHVTRVCVAFLNRGSSHLWARVWEQPAQQ